MNVRDETMARATQMLKERQAKVLVECGSIRRDEPHVEGDCCGTYEWAKYCEWAERNGITAHLWTVDIDPDCTQFTEKHAARWKKWITAETRDARVFLRNFPSRIDFVYLDATDCYVSGYKEQHQEMYQNMRDKLSSNAIILIDDCGYDRTGGKGELVFPLAKEDGFVIVMSQYQTLMAR